MERRFGDRLERRQDRGVRHDRPPVLDGEELELAGLRFQFRLDPRQGFWLGDIAVEPDQQARAATLELERPVRGLLQLTRLEPSEHPADRCRLRGVLGVDRARHDEAVDCPRHRDVVEAAPFGLGFRALRLLDLFVRGGAAALARGGMRDPETEPAVGQRENLVRRRPRPVSPRVGDDDDLELEPLRCMDRQQTDDVGILFLGHGLEFLCADLVLLADEADEALNICAPQVLVGTRQPRELAQVRVAPAPVPLGEHGEVVIVRRDDLLAEPLERKRRHRGREPVVALLERLEQALVARRELLWQGAFHAGEERPSANPAPQQHEGVVGDADER